MLGLRKMMLTTSIIASFSVFAVSIENEQAYEEALKSFHKKDYAETVIHLKNALNNNLEHIPSRLLLAETLIEQGKGPQAETELHDLQAAGVDFNQLVILFARAYLLQDKFNDVIDTVTPGFRGKSVESDIYFYRGQAYLGLKQFSLADNAYIDSLLIEPKHKKAKLGRAQVAIINEQFPLAIKLIDEVQMGYEPSVNGYLLKANVLQLQNRLDEALVEINKALKLSPKHMPALVMRAGVYIASEQPTLAKADLEWILEEIPEEPRAKFLMAVVDTMLGSEDQSKERLKQVLTTLNAVPIEVMENNPSYFFLTGLVNYEFGNLTEARVYLEHFLRLKETDVTTIRLLATIELKQGKANIAKKLLKKANVYQPSNPNILALLGITYMETGNIDKAKRYFQQVVQIVPRFEGALTNLAQSEIESGNYQAAINQLLSAKDIAEESISIQLLLVDAYIRNRELDKALKITEKLSQSNLENSYYFQLHGSVLGRLGRVDEAKVSLEKSLALNGNNVAALTHLARLDVIEGNGQVALEKMQSALIQYPDSIEIMLEIADVYGRIGEQDQSINWYQKAFDNDRESPSTLGRLVAAYVEQGKYKEAEQAYSSFLQLYPNENNTRINLGRLYLEMNQPHKAISTLVAAINDAKNKTDALMLLARAQLAIDDRIAAVKSLNRAMAWDEERLEPVMMLFPIVLSLGYEERSKQLINLVHQLTEGNEIALILAGDLAMKTHRYNQAVKFYQQALQKQPSQRALLGQFNALVKQDKLSQAQAVISSWLDNTPDDVLAELAYAESLSLQKQHKDALTYYQKLLSKYNNLPLLLNNAAMVAYQNNDQALAEQYAKQAYEQAPNNSAIIDTYAWIQSLGGQHQPAITLFRKALTLDFDNPEIKYHLAVTLSKVDRNNEAIKLLIEAVESEEDFADKEQAKQLIQALRAAA